MGNVQTCKPSERKSKSNLIAADKSQKPTQDNKENKNKKQKNNSRSNSLQIGQVKSRNESQEIIIDKFEAENKQQDDNYSLAVILDQEIYDQENFMNKLKKFLPCFSQQHQLGKNLDFQQRILFITQNFNFDNIKQDLECLENTTQFKHLDILLLKNCDDFNHYDETEQEEEEIQKSSQRDIINIQGDNIETQIEEKLNQEGQKFQLQSLNLGYYITNEHNIYLTNETFEQIIEQFENSD